MERFLPAHDLALERLFTLDKPVVAAVNGHAIAGGAILVAACDRRILARGPATFGAPELKVGVPFPPLPLELYRRICPPGRASELALGGRVVGTDEARSRSAWSTSWSSPARCSSARSRSHASSPPCRRVPSR